MDIGSNLIIIALVIPVALFIARPFIEQRATAVTTEEHDFSALLAERDRILDALQELEFDHALGKIPEEDYAAQRAYLMHAGADILRQMDEYEEQPGAASVDDRLEAAIAERKAAAEPPADDELETLIALRRREKAAAGKSQSSGFCPQCGGPVYKSDRFCPKCGHALE